MKLVNNNNKKKKMKKKSHFTNNIIYRISVGKILQGKEE
jgi:hypothetical protein